MSVNETKLTSFSGGWRRSHGESAPQKGSTSSQTQKIEAFAKGFQRGASGTEKKSASASSSQSSTPLPSRVQPDPEASRALRAWMGKPQQPANQEESRTRRQAILARSRKATLSRPVDPEVQKALNFVNSWGPVSEERAKKAFEEFVRDFVKRRPHAVLVVNGKNGRHSLLSLLERIKENGFSLNEAIRVIEVLNVNGLSATLTDNYNKRLAKVLTGEVVTTSNRGVCRVLIAPKKITVDLEMSFESRKTKGLALSALGGDRLMWVLERGKEAVIDLNIPN